MTCTCTPMSTCAECAEKMLPKMPEPSYLGDDVSYGYDESDMRAYAIEAIARVYTYLTQTSR